jgi:hypothetical protein
MSFFLSTYPLSITFVLSLGICLFVYLLTNLMLTTTFILLWACGCIDISPFFKCIDLSLEYLFKDSVDLFKKNIKESFPVHGTTDTKKQLIYIFHPHGTFSLSHAFNVISDMTDWPRHDMQAVTHSWLMITPLLPRVFSDKFVSSDYEAINIALKNGKSISVCLGGSREGAYGVEDNSIIAVVKSRRGMFKLAIQHGIPIVPVLSYGEIKNMNLDKILQSFKRWGKIYKGILDTKIETHIGKEIDAGKAREPTEADIFTLKKKYIEGLKELYKETRPSNYKEEIVIV